MLQSFWDEVYLSVCIVVLCYWKSWYILWASPAVWNVPVSRELGKVCPQGLSQCRCTVSTCSASE